MELITESQLRSVRNAFEKAQGFRTFSDYVNENKTRRSTSTEVTIFLSHKHDEVEQLKDAIALLKRHSVNIYIDHNDEEMPKTTSGLTAYRLKQKIRENKKFILLATEKAIESKWCNWELGFGDAHKYIDQIALLVIKGDNKNWTGNEYLQIYPIIGRSNSLREEYVVQFPDNRTINLATWLISK
jgi:hypothetical protein